MNINLAAIFSFFIFQKVKCNHEKVTPLSKCNYCPDCGVEIKIKWHLVRCGCCNTKRQGFSSYNKIFPTDTYCEKCGEKHFYIENIERIEFYELSMAVWTKEQISQKSELNSKTQVWVDEKVLTTNLIPIY